MPSSYYVAPALLQLCDEVDTHYAPPEWPTLAVGDGAIGDTSHQARPSDHNPDYSAGGVVRAVDIGIEGRNAKEILNNTIGDSRVWYVIHRGIIYSRTYGFKAQRYTGSNAHDHHIHVSLQGKNGISAGLAYDIAHDESLWWAPEKPKTVGSLYLPNVRRQFQIRMGLIEGKIKKVNGVRVVQLALNEEYDLKLPTDGIVGPRTIKAWHTHEIKHPGSGNPSIPDKKSLSALPLKVRVEGE